MKKSNVFLRRTILGIIVSILLVFTINQSSINITLSITDDQIRNPSLLALTPHEAIEIISDDNFTDYGFPGTGIETDPYIIEGYNISTTESKGISIEHTTKYFIIRNCYVDALDCGIYIDNAADGTATVTNSTSCNNDYCGIYLKSSANSTFTNNTCNNNSDGIKLVYSSNSTVTDNTCNNNRGRSGIFIGNSRSSTVANNTCSNNNYEGIALYSSGSSTVTSNTCNNNTHGIYISDSEFCYITYNLLQENEDYGVYLRYNSENNLIHHNTFVDNNLGGTSQAYDDGINNTWYDTATQEGNYWSDWSGTGAYSIDGSADAVDLYPLGEPVVAEYPQIILLTLLLPIVILFLPRIISKKLKK